jgi:aconitate hydratase A / 2-methylisocitrate dehydratase
MPGKDVFGARDTLEGQVAFYRLSRLEELGVGRVSRLPFSVKVLLEAALRTCDGYEVTEDDVRNLATWNAKDPKLIEFPFKPARVIMQDMTGVPAVVDLAAMRAAAWRLGGDPNKINPLVPVDLVIDHSVQVDYAGALNALARNAEMEFARNRERYEFLRWGQKAFANFRVVPPATGIVHQVNLEFLARVVLLRDGVAFPDTLVGTDSHTTMINGLGVLGWGVGGIEAEAVMLGQPIYMLTPQVVGFKLFGKLREGVTATDLTLTVTQMLRKKGVVDKFVEFYGPGLSQITLADRATIANMAPDYGATMSFFPVDAETLRYLRLTGRGDVVPLVERYVKAQGLFRTDETPAPEFSDTIELNLDDVEPSLAGPKRPQDRVALREMKVSFRKALTAPVKERGFGLSESDLDKRVVVRSDDFSRRQAAEAATTNLTHGSVIIAAITSCTNTSNPSVMVGAGLVAKKAIERGLRPPAYVKTSLAPGSQVVTEYLRDAGLLPYLEQIGFNVVGYGCTTCIGNSGPIAPEITQAVSAGNLVAVAVLSGNRNFEGRIHPVVKANYLASPPLVVAYALAGTTDIDFTTEPMGYGKDGQAVFLRDLWPTQAEIAEAISAHIKPEMFQKTYANVFDGNPTWNAITGSEGELYQWNPDSTYIQEPPFFVGLSFEPGGLRDIRGARVLALVGDSVTTDHISPAGDIAENSPAGRYLKAHGIEKRDFNTYGARRGNDQVLVRGTFANIRLKNLMLGGEEGGNTLYLGGQRSEVGGQPEKLSIYDAAMKYKADGVPLVVIAGKEYGTGSSRDWAAKGPMLLGIKAALAESFERIHRSNLVGMGVLPLQFKDGQSAESLGLTGHEIIDIEGIGGEALREPRQDVTVRATRPDGSQITFTMIARLDTPVEVNYYRNGGILPTVLRRLVKDG